MQKFPEDADLNYNMAQASFLLGKTDQAIKYLERTLFLASEDVEALLKLASLYRKIGRLADSRQLLIKASNLEKESADVWYELGVVYSDLADYQNGISAFQKALHFSRNEEQKFLIIYYTGLLYLSDRDYENFKDCLRRLRSSQKYYVELEKLGRLWRSD